MQHRDQHGSQPDVGIRVFLRPIGTPLPLGFLGLAGGTFTLAGLQLGWIPVVESRSVGLALVAFAVPLQLLAAVYGFLTRDSVAGTGMGVLAGTWLTTGLILLLSLPGSTSGALGLLLLAAAAALLVPLLGAGMSKLTASAVLSLAALRFALTGAYQLTADPAWETASGAVGVVLAVAALCGALAFESEETLGRALLPTLRRGDDPLSAESAGEEVAGIHHEAGVRKKL